MFVRAIIKTATPAKAAEAFALTLALEKGFTSCIVADGEAWVVVASDDQAVRFEPLNLVDRQTSID